MTDLNQHLDDLVIANRILAHEGVIDAFGHLSIRHPDHPDRYIQSCSRSPEFVTREDLMEFTLDSTPLTGLDKKPYGERFIHGGALEARPEINAVIHNHSHEVIPFGVTGIKLRPLAHVASSIGPEVPIWDIRDDFGDATTMLVVNVEQGRSLARGLGQNNVVLMRGHGCVVVGRTLRQAVASAIYLQVNAKIQIESAGLSGMDSIAFLSEGEIEAMQAYEVAPKTLDRAWQYWARRAGC